MSKKKNAAEKIASLFNDLRNKGSRVLTEAGVTTEFMQDMKQRIDSIEADISQEMEKAEKSDNPATKLYTVAQEKLNKLKTEKRPGTITGMMLFVANLDNKAAKVVEQHESDHGVEAVRDFMSGLLNGDTAEDTVHT